MKRVLITGASGFVGANLVRRLLRDGYDIHVLLRKDYRHWRLRDITRDIHIHFVDFQNQSSLNSLLRTISADWIFHTAVYGAYSRQQDIDEMASTNILGTAHLLDAASRVGFEAFVNTGSSSEYGYLSSPPKETHLLHPNSNYAITKAAATHLCQLKAEQTRLHIPTLRLYSVYGPFEEPTRLIPTLLEHARAKTLPILVDPTVARDFVYADDVVDAYIKAAKTKTRELGSIFNIGSGTQTTLKKIVSLMLTEFAVDRRPKWGSMPNRSWDTSTWVADVHKAKKILHWQPKTSLQDGLKRTSAWLTDHGKEYVASRPRAK
jgi:nucleoside-diphosphate-sugar epimerase